MSISFDDFKKSLSNSAPPPQFSEPLKALWFDGKGDWEAAHYIAQDIHSETGSWIHAYLHRKEGDLGNASYWYRQAKRPVETKSNGDEWEKIVKELLIRQ